MGIDHSATYKDRRLRNMPHRRRLEKILSILEAQAPPEGGTYADVGCSNGYITGLVCKRIRPARACGFDHEPSNLAQARKRYPHVHFELIDLNRPNPPPGRFDLVTSFEVLEHVGDLTHALDNLVGMTKPATGLLMLTAPIEIGWRGTLKFLAKTLLFRYSLSELPPRRHLYASYLASLLAGRRMSRFRDKRDGWGTHFGFDFRDIDEYLESRGISFEASNHFMSRFYLARP